MKFLAYDLGTGGVKASLYDEGLNTLAKSVIDYETYYPEHNFHEQRPEDWWRGVIKSTRQLLAEAKVSPQEIRCVALSGHSCVAVPLDEQGRSLVEYVPIWSDTRAAEQAKRFFEQVDGDLWYMTTGNGFPAPCYCLFKLMWYKQHMPRMFGQIRQVVGSKDYINLRLTGKIAIDHSYASGTGAYDLKQGKMCEDFFEAAGIPSSFFPEIVPSHSIVGYVTEEAAREIGLAPGTAVACGGVDNACMALGAVGPQSGQVYASLGSSSWIPVNSRDPILDAVKRPYVFAHIQEGMFTSAFSIFAGGSSLRWAKENLCSEWGEDAYVKIEELAANSAVGANGILFNPSLAGGTSQDKSVNIRGGFVGLNLGSTRADMLRAVLEGVALNLRCSLEYLKQKARLTDQILFCGGGSQMRLWMQIFADVFGMNIIKTNIEQDAASVGAAAICARAVGHWPDYEKVLSLHRIVDRFTPDAACHAKYEPVYRAFNRASELLSDLGDFVSTGKEIEG